MPRLIIDYPDEMPPENACYYALQTVRQGRISEASGVAHFCWVTRFVNLVEVFTRRKRSVSAADSLRMTVGKTYLKTEEEQASDQENGVRVQP